MRLALLSHEPSRQVLSAVASMSGWGQPLAAGRGRGVAFHLCRVVPAAEVVETTTSKEGVKIDKVLVAVDVGTALDRARADRWPAGVSPPVCARTLIQGACVACPTTTYQATNAALTSAPGR